MLDPDGRDIRSPVERIELPRRRRRANDWLREDEDRALLCSPMMWQEKIVVYLLRWTGLRVSEACALKISDVDLTAGDIRVRDSKSSAGMRTVPIAPELEPVLELWLARLRERDDYCEDMFVLATKHGTPMKPQYAWRLVKRAAARAGVREQGGRGRQNVSAITNHTLRRTFGSHLLNKRVRIETVSKLLGHQDTRVTEACYAELLPEQIRQEFHEALAP